MEKSPLVLAIIRIRSKSNYCSYLNIAQAKVRRSGSEWNLVISAPPYGKAHGNDALI